MNHKSSITTYSPVNNSVNSLKEEKFAHIVHSTSTNHILITIEKQHSIEKSRWKLTQYTEVLSSLSFVIFQKTDLKSLALKPEYGLHAMIKETLHYLKSFRAVLHVVAAAPT